ncbi:MAG: ELM1/GtrOC1 family putative glycosyltransferase [Sphingomicrobium sp.]
MDQQGDLLGLVSPVHEQLDENIAPPRAQPLVWLMLGNRLGDNNQLLALAEGLGLPFETKLLAYNQLRRLPRFLRGARLISLTRSARRLIKPPWPDLVIGVGYGSVPVARYIRHQAGGATRLVQIGNPRSDISDLDLVITTPQYARDPAPNVLALPLPIGNPAACVTVSDNEEQWLRGYPHPHRLFAIGGPTRNWKIDRAELIRAIGVDKLRCEHDGGTIVVVTSPRTDARTRHSLAQCLAGTRHAMVEDFPRFPVLLARSDEIYVTADSVSMLAEAMLTGKPVGMIRIAPSLRGRVSAWLDRNRLKPRPYPDLPNFWHLLSLHDLVGTVDSPIACTVTDTVSTAANAVRKLLDRPTP